MIFDDELQLHEDVCFAYATQLSLQRFVGDGKPGNGVERVGVAADGRTWRSALSHNLLRLWSRTSHRILRGLYW